MRKLEILISIILFQWSLYGQYYPMGSILEVEGPPYSNIQLGTGIAGLGDVNGDGKPDFAVSAWNAKKTYFYYGGKDVQQGKMILDGIADDSIKGGGQIETGDLNGDGILDLIIKINGDSAGVDYLAFYPGTTNVIHKYDSVPALIIREEQISSGFGNSFAIGDLNKDGFDDLVVGAPEFDYKGKVYIYMGKETPSDKIDFYAVGDTQCTRYAHTVKIADVNGDKIKDLLIGSDRYLQCSGNADYLTLDIYYCSFNWNFNKNNYTYRYTNNNRYLNYISDFSVADINDDSIIDIGFRGDSTRMFFIFGDKDSLSSLPDYYIKKNPSDVTDFGYIGPVSNIGDINNDGKNDFVIRASSYGQRCIHLFLGNSSPPSDYTSARCKGQHAFNIAVSLGDVDGDGYNDFGSTEPYGLFETNGYFVIFEGDNFIADVNEPRKIPEINNLKQNYPNPFNPVTTIEYSVEKPGYFSITIYNATGQKIKTLVNEFHNTGNYKIEWNGTDDSGNNAASGIYYYQLNTPANSGVRKAILLK